MPKYHVSVPVYANVFVVVEAESEETAIVKAERSRYPSVCAQCAVHVEIGELDDSGESSAMLISD